MDQFKTVRALCVSLLIRGLTRSVPIPADAEPTSSFVCLAGTALLVICFVFACVCSFCVCRAHVLTHGVTGFRTPVRDGVRY